MCIQAVSIRLYTRILYGCGRRTEEARQRALPVSSPRHLSGRQRQRFEFIYEYRSSALARACGVVLAPQLLDELLDLSPEMSVVEVAAHLRGFEGNVPALQDYLLEVSPA